MAGRPAERNQRYDRGVGGNPPIKLDITNTRAHQHEVPRDEPWFDRRADEARNDVRREEHTAD